LSDRIFCAPKAKKEMVEIMIADILYIEADETITTSLPSEKEYYSLSVTLKTIEENFRPTF